MLEHLKRIPISGLLYFAGEANPSDTVVGVPLSSEDRADATDAAHHFGVWGLGFAFGWWLWKCYQDASFEGSSYWERFDFQALRAFERVAV